MKSNLLLTLAALMLSMTIFSCDNVTKEKVSDGADDLVEGVMEPASIDEIPYSTANTDITRYNDIFGGENVYKYIGEEGNAEGSTMVPRYYVINRAAFQGMIDNNPDATEFFASLGATKEDFSGSPEGFSHVSDLVFHVIRPNANGSLNNQENDSFYDYAQPCPINCNSGTGVSDQPFDAAIAISRINKYNTVYGGEDQYIEADGKKVVIPRYYAVKKADFQEVLNSTTNATLYVSLAAVEQNPVVTNTYNSDLIFHHVRPNPQGYLTSSEDQFYDVSVPCPDECN
jgi:hypothetical protein